MRKRLASAMSEASLSSWGRRFCRAPNLRAPAGLGRAGGDARRVGEGRARPGSGCPCPPCRRPRACESSGCRGRASGTARARRPPREAPGKGAFLGDEEGRVDLAGGVVHGDAHCRPDTHSWREPCSARRGRLRRWAPRSGSHAAMGLQGQPDVAALDAMTGDQLLVKVPGVEVPVPGVEQFRNLRRLVRVGPARRDPAQAAVVQPFRALRLVAPAPEGAFVSNRRYVRYQTLMACSPPPPTS